MPLAIAVALGGMLGALARYGVARGLLAVGVIPSHVPWATLAVNVIGSAAAGYLFARHLAHPTPETWHTFLFIGVLGGFTTFSSFALEGLTMFMAGHRLWALLYLFGSPLLGLAAAAVGFKWGR